VQTKSNVSAAVVVQMVLLGAIWGGAFTLIKVLVDGLSPIEIAVGRLLAGALAVAIWLHVRGMLRVPPPALLAPIALLAVLDTVAPYALVGWAESHIDSGAAAVLISTMPLFTVAFAAALLPSERAGGTKLAGVGIGFAGVLVMVGSPRTFTGSTLAGQLAVVGAASSYALGALYARRLLTRIDAPNLVASKLALGAAVAAVAMAGRGQGAALLELSPSHAAALLTLGIVCTGISFVMYFRVVAVTGSVGGSTVTYIIPAFGLLFGALFLGETIEPRTIGGMALIAAGVATVMYLPGIEQAAVWRRLRPAAAAQERCV